MLPVPSDLQGLLRRLAHEEREQARALARLEERLRRFEDVDKPSFERWRRLEFGPTLAALETLHEEMRARQILAHRVMDLVDRQGFRAREALYVALHPEWTPDVDAGGFDPDEVHARRRAKIERKRAERKKAARDKRSTAQPADTATSPPKPNAARVTTLYRALARRLHPDSPTRVRFADPTRLRAVWDEVQAAVVAGSVERLLAISAWLDTAEEAGDEAPPTAPVLSLAERHERLRALSRSCRALERRLLQLETHPAWGFADTPGKVRRRLHKDTARDLDEEFVRAREAMEQVEAFFAEIGAPKRPPDRRR